MLKQGAEHNFKLGDIYIYSDTEDELLQHFTIYSRGSCEAELLSRVHFSITCSDSAVIVSLKFCIACQSRHTEAWPK